MEIDFQPVTDFLNGVAEQYGVPACECVIWRAHQPLYHHAAGTMEWKGGAAVQGGEWYWVYSCTKLMTATAVLQLMEQGKLGLDDPVCRYLPAYARMTVREGETVRPAKTVLTIHHLLTMTGGFHYNHDCPPLMEIRRETNGQASTRQVIDALAQEPLCFDPGTHFQYSLCHDVLGAVIEAISGESFSGYVQRHIATPLGITGLTFAPTEAQLARMPEQICWHDQRKELFLCEKDNSHQLTPNYDSGGAGVCCRAEDYILFLDALACDGVGANGTRILQESSVELMRRNHLSGTPLEDFHHTMKPETEGYGLGVRMRLTDDGIIPPGEFGWDGAAGATAVAEPKSQLSVFYVQHVLNYLPSYAELHPNLLKRIYQCIRAKE